MGKYKIVLMLILLAVFCSLGIFFLYLISQGNMRVEDDDNNLRTSFVLPMENRSYKVGITGYFPSNFPNSNLSEIQSFYSDINDYAEVYGVHTDIDNLKIIDTTFTNYDGEIELVTGLSDDSLWSTNLAPKFIDNLSKYLTKYSQIKYVAIGNEINYHFDLDTETFERFFETYKLIYAELKNDFPEVNFFTTFQYDFLRGEAYLTGRPMKPEFELLSKMEPYIDLVGLTIYPSFDYKTPEEIPNNYLKILKSYSDKPIAITESAWLSRTSFDNELDGSGYEGSEDEQIEYLKRLAVLLNDEDVEFVNWFTLHDISDWQKDSSPQNQLLFDSMGLKKHEGEEKKVWKVWKELYSIQR